jgi:prepilin signal peptidase PulO-like enzyme (type II secretory pathway)
MSLASQALSAATLTLVALAVFIVGSRFGQRNVDHWLTDEERQQLQRIQRPWWPIVLALGLAIALLQRTVPMDSSIPIAMVIGQAVFLGTYLGLLAALARIDMICRLLPDQLTASLLMSGLLFHAVFETGGLVAGITGAALGYGLLWLLASLFQRLRGQEAMGRGDFFMAAGLGAWLGWYGLPMALMLASGSALIAAVALHFMNMRKPGQNPDTKENRSLLKREIAFGPALCLGGIATLVLHHG